MQSEPEAKGLFRAALGGNRKTIAAAFERLARNEDAFPHLDNRRWNARQTCVELPPDEGTGCWRLISVSNEVFAVITNCNYISPRHERVPSEGLVEFHFVLEGPVVLDLPRDRTAETTVTAATMMVCHQAPGVAYDVSCAPGAFRMISLYVQPKLLTESYGFGLGDDSDARQLLNPADRTMVIVEKSINIDFVRVLRELFDLQFAEPRELMLAVAKIFELLALSVEELDKRSSVTDSSMMFTEKELDMFARASEILSTDFTSNLTISGLARLLGTNSTKLKSGFKLLYGMTIFNYRNRYRMMRAMELLVEQKQPISAVAQAVGYEHQASFTSAFKAHFGFAPKSARQMAKKSGTIQDGAASHLRQVRSSESGAEDISPGAHDPRGA
jgi:AraC-like DNA-binding protein